MSLWGSAFGSFRDPTTSSPTPSAQSGFLLITYFHFLDIVNLSFSPTEVSIVRSFPSIFLNIPIGGWRENQWDRKGSQSGCDHLYFSPFPLSPFLSRCPFSGIYSGFFLGSPRRIPARLNHFKKGFSYSSQGLFLCNKNARYLVTLCFG